MAQKTQNLGNRTKLSSSEEKSVVMKVFSLIRTMLLAVLLTIIIIAQGIIITQNDMIGKEVQWITFLVEGDKKREPKPRPFSDPTSPRGLRSHKINISPIYLRSNPNEAL